MTNIFRQLLEAALFPANASGTLIVIPQAWPEQEAELDRKTSGSYQFPMESLPHDCEVRQVPANEFFPSALRQLIEQFHPERVYLWPPALRPRLLPPNVRAVYPAADLSEIALLAAAQSAGPSTHIGATLPLNFFGGETPRSIREAITQAATPRLVIAHDHPWDGFHRAFRFGTIILDKGEPSSPTLKFFRCPVITTEAEQVSVLSDFKRLLRQDGGQTEYGYVLRDGLPPGAKLLYEMYRPELIRREKNLSHYGGIRQLKDLVHLHRGLHTINEANTLMDRSSGQGIPVVEGRDIRADGSIAYTDTRYVATASLDRQLQCGDICLRAIVGNDPRLHVARIEDDMLPLLAAQTVVVLRPEPSTTPEDREFLVSYLRSALVAEILRSRGLQLHLTQAALLNLPVPIADDTLRLALREMNDAVAQFDLWKKEAELARSTLFSFSSPSDDRLALLTLGLRLKQRLAAAQQVGTLQYRIRTQFPHPIAYRWRIVEAARPDLPGYLNVLDCAEILACYCACVAILSAQAAQVPITWLGEMAKWLSARNGHGTSFGDWVGVLREVRNSKDLRKASTPPSFYEVVRFLDDQDVDNALQELKDHRDDQSHGRGPKTDLAVQQAFDECRSALELLLENTEFLTGYPIRYVEQTHRDSLEKTTRYEYRELMGDHPLVPISHGQTPDSDLEARSLYLVDRHDKLHLLRPLLTRQECATCGNWATFYLDGYDAKRGVCILKSMEHNHTIDNGEVVKPFQQVGLLLAKR